MADVQRLLNQEKRVITEPRQETLGNIEESCAARLAGNQDQHRALSRRTRTLLGRDKDRYVRSLAEDVEGHLNANDLRPAYRALKKLRSKFLSRSVNANFGYMGMWHATLKPILPIGLNLYETIRRGGGQGVDHKARGWGKLMLPVESCLIWERSLYGDSCKVTPGSAVVGSARRRSARRMPLMID
ncbi:hypothetical protein GWK47_047281 [Chionoecetes opilio]|uniref:Uncharacterized protein n=1 Tax=Chionoecetes opilio TaxID=41210 RepID=A0A8J4Y3V3_CHIOP|nr:hypothetical protein GWK47_047281 [Chionoecetes opilio]